MYSDVPAGLDYVGHEDILPFSANNEEPFQHDLVNQFFPNSTVNQGTDNKLSMPPTPFSHLDLRQLVTCIWETRGHQKHVTHL